MIAAPKRLPTPKVTLIAAALLSVITVVELVWAIGSGGSWLRWVFVGIFATSVGACCVMYRLAQRDDHRADI